MNLNEDLTQSKKLKVSASGPITRAPLKSMDLDNGVQIGRMPAKVVKRMMSPRGKANISPKPEKHLKTEPT